MEFDLQKMLIGDLPWTFTFEIVVRTMIMYLFTVLVVRLMGKRGMGQIAPFEFVIIVALGSAVGDPMFYPDVPLLHAMVVLTTIVVLHRGLAWVTEGHEQMERFVEGAPARVIADGRILTESLDHEEVSRSELFSLLRQEGIEHLGEVRLGYLETSGRLSVFRLPDKEIRQGLSTLPEDNPAGAG